jgi:hypothetical protein
MPNATKSPTVSSTTFHVAHGFSPRAIQAFGHQLLESRQQGAESVQDGRD